MRDSLKKALEELKEKTAKKFGTDHPIELLGFGVIAYSDRLETDERKGVCEDGTLNAIRYKVIEPEHIYKMPAKKMISQLASTVRLSSEACSGLNFGEFEIEWIKIQTKKDWNSYELVIDDDFEDLWNGDRVWDGTVDRDALRGNSMLNGDFYKDYETKIVKLKVNGTIMASAILWEEVFVDDDNDSIELLGHAKGKLPYRLALTEMAQAKGIATCYATDYDIVDIDGEVVREDFYVQAQFHIGQWTVNEPTFRFWDPLLRRLVMTDSGEMDYRLWRLNDNEVVGWYLSDWNGPTIEPVVDLLYQGEHKFVTLKDVKENFTKVDGKWVRKDAYVVDFQGIQRERCHCVETLSGKFIVSNLSIFIERHEGFALPDEACLVGDDWELKTDCVRNGDGTWRLKEL